MGCHECPDAISVTALDDYVLKVEFADGSVKTCDFSDHLNKGVFRKLRDVSFFRKAHDQDGAIVWDETLDCAPEHVYFNN